MARERLTSRARQAADDQTPYPGSINQEGREEEQRGSNTYRTFEPSVANHELTDFSKVHGVSDQHNEIGFGIPDPASGMLVASSEYQAKCIKVAELAETYLGPKVGDRMLLAQARDFLSLTDESLDRTLERFNRTDTLYVAEEEETGEEEAGEEETPVEEAAEGEPEVEIEATPAPAAEVAIDSAPQANDEPGNPTRQIPQMPEGEAAAPTAPGAGSMSPEAAASAPEAAAAPVVEVEEAMVMSEARAANLTNLAACTLKAEECTQENIVVAANKFASLDNDQIKSLLAGYGKECVAEEVAEEIDGEEAEVAAEEAPVIVEEEAEVEVATASTLDVGSFDLSEEFNDGPVTATAEEEAELASIFGDTSAVAPVSAIDPQQQAIMASVAQLSGTPLKTASKMGIKSIGNVSLQGGAQAPAAQQPELESLWASPNDFPAGGF